MRDNRDARFQSSRYNAPSTAHYDGRGSLRQVVKGRAHSEEDEEGVADWGDNQAAATSPKRVTGKEGVSNLAGQISHTYSPDRISSFIISHKLPIELIEPMVRN